MLDNNSKLGYSLFETNPETENMATFQVKAILDNGSRFKADMNRAQKVLQNPSPLTTATFSLSVEAPSEQAALEITFAKLNHGSGEEAEGYRLRSLSVGDIVILNGTAYLCASLGWERIP
jgi:hypothetical protein